MRILKLLLVSLLLSSPLLLSPAHGATVSDTRCVDEAACVAVDACATTPDCVGADACAQGTGVDASFCFTAHNCHPGELGAQCAVEEPCLEVADGASLARIPVDCLPEPRPVGWDACVGSRTQFSFPLFTGRGANGQGSAPGTLDPLWRVVAYPPADWQPAVLSGPAYSRGVQPVSSYVWDSSSSWINPFATADWGPGGQYVFQTQYFVPTDAYGVTLSGRYAVDNSALVSDTDATLSRLLSTSAVDAFAFWTYIPDTTLSTGLHTLDVNLYNRHAGSYVGANVEFIVEGYCKPKGPILGTEICGKGQTSFSIRLHTGVDALGTPQPNGVVDTRWTAGGNLPGPAFSRGQDPLPGAWVTDPASSWISTFSGAPDYAGLTGPVGYFGYQVNYFLPANAYNVAVSGRAAADNHAILADTDVLQSTFVASTPSPNGFASWTPFSYSVGTLGYHTFSASVYNEGGPTGLNVVAWVTGRCHAIIDADTPVDRILERL